MQVYLLKVNIIYISGISVIVLKFSVAKYPFKPSDVYACLKTIPTDKDLGTAQIAWIQSFLQFQSTLAWLKSPPPTYQLPAVDLVGSLNNISKAITAGKYQNEYQLELDIYNVFTSAADGHLNYKPYLVSIPILRNASLVSVSLDGVQVPKVYASSKFFLLIMNFPID